MTATGPARLRRGAARRHERPEGSGEPQRGAPVNTPAGRPDRDRVEGRPLSPRAFRHFGIEAVLVGAAVRQEGLLRREGVAIWRRLEPQAAVFDRVAEQSGGAEGELLAVRVVVATTPARDRSLRVPAVGERAARVTAAAERPPPTGWLLLVDEGPGETWLYLAEERAPDEVLAGFLGRRGRTDFARARRRSRLGRHPDPRPPPLTASAGNQDERYRHCQVAFAMSVLGSGAAGLGSGLMNLLRRLCSARNARVGGLPRHGPDRETAGPELPGAA